MKRLLLICEFIFKLIKLRKKKTLSSDLRTTECV